MNQNYQKELDKKIEEFVKEGKVPKLLLHSCCAPCSSYVIEYLSEFFHITIYFYNPNIAPAEEYHRRVEEQIRLIEAMDTKYPVQFIEGDYNTEEFYRIAKGLENVPEGGERCFACYRLRLGAAAKIAKENGFDYFTTTLSISPMKNAQKLNEIGAEFAEQTGILYLYSDFKKKNGYKRSIELSKEYDLYRQDFCGCAYSRRSTE